MHVLLNEILTRRIGRSITTRDIVDIMNIIGRCVISGNISRVAEIAFGEARDQEFVDLKNYTKHPDR